MTRWATSPTLCTTPSGRASSKFAAVMGSLLCSSSAEAISADQLAKFCQGRVGTNVKAAAEMTCEGYIRGLVDGLLFGTMAARRYCPPGAGIDVDSARTIILRHIVTHPDESTLEAGDLGATALLCAFSCHRN